MSSKPFASQSQPDTATSAAPMTANTIIAPPAQADALTFSRLQQHQNAFLQWLGGSDAHIYQYVR